MFADAGVARHPPPLPNQSGQRQSRSSHSPAGTHLSFIVNHPRVAGPVVRGTGTGRPHGGRAGKGGRGLPPLRHRTRRRRLPCRSSPAVATLQGASLEGIAVARRDRRITHPPRHLREMAAEEAADAGVHWQRPPRAAGVDNRGIERRRHASRAALRCSRTASPSIGPATTSTSMAQSVSGPRRRTTARLGVMARVVQQAGRRPRDPRLRGARP